MATFTESLTFNVHTCGTCGVEYAVTDGFEARRRKDHASFYCPNGHSAYYPQKNETERLREQLAAKEREVLAARSARDRETERRREAEAETRRQVRKVSARKGVTTRLKRKIAAGACPCCSKKFKDLAVHMKTEHPKWDPEKHADALEAKEQG